MNNVYTKPGSTAIDVTQKNNTASNLAAGLDPCEIGVETDTGLIGCKDASGNYQSMAKKSVLNVGQVPMGKTVATGEYENSIITQYNSLIGIDNATPDVKFHIKSNVGQELKIESTGNDDPKIVLDADRTGADNLLGTVRGYWNGTNVAAIGFVTGADTVNKDSGYINFYTRDDDASLAEKMRILGNGNIGIGTTGVPGILTLNKDTGADPRLGARYSNGPQTGSSGGWTEDTTNSWIELHGKGSMVGISAYLNVCGRLTDVASRNKAWAGILEIQWTVDATEATGYGVYQYWKNISGSTITQGITALHEVNPGPTVTITAESEPDTNGSGTVTIYYGDGTNTMNLQYHFRGQLL